LKEITGVQLDTSSVLNILATYLGLGLLNSIWWFKFLSLIFLLLFSIVETFAGFRLSLSLGGIQ